MEADRERSAQIRDNLKQRIEEQITYFGGEMPERHTIAWRGYLAALFEAGILDYRHYTELTHLMPKIKDPNPIPDLFDFEPDNPLLHQ